MTSGDNSSTTEPSPFPPPLVSDTLQYRLLTGNIAKQGGQRGSITRCAQKYGLFQSQLSATEPDAATIEKSKDDLGQDLRLYQIELTKLVLLQRNLEKQVQENLVAEEERKERLETLAREVQICQQEANHSQETRSCFLEYEALAKLANEKHSHSSRQLQGKIEKVNSEITHYQEEEAVTDQLLKIRESQFHVLMQYMLDLKRTITDTEEQESSVRRSRQKFGEKSEEPRIVDEIEKADAMETDEDAKLYQDL